MRCQEGPQPGWSPPNPQESGRPWQWNLGEATIKLSPRPAASCVSWVGGVTSTSDVTSTPPPQASDGCRRGGGGRGLGPRFVGERGRGPGTAEGRTWGSVARPRPCLQPRRDLRGRGRPGGARGSSGDSRRGEDPHREAWERRAHRPPTPLPEAPPNHPAGSTPYPGPPGLHARPLSPPRDSSQRAERLAQAPTRDSRGVLSPPPPTRDIKNMLTPVSLQCRGLRLSGAPPGAPPAPLSPPQRRHHRKQPHPRRGSEKGDPGFEGVTLKFQIKPDASVEILPCYSLACSSRSVGGPAAPTSVSEANQGGSEALGPRRCASCKTERTPLWRDAEDGTPLCNACGIRYKKYGTRCSGCWLVPRKSVQPKRLCGRCGVSLGPLQDAVEEG